MQLSLKEILDRINSYSLKQVDIRKYCRERMEERNVEETLLTTTLFSGSLYYAEEQMKMFGGKPEKRHKLDRKSVV
jgi:DNA helicase HerA-like ATPase